MLDAMARYIEEILRKSGVQCDRRGKIWPERSEMEEIRLTRMTKAAG